jgi:peptidoglycan/xylan/chitin deacetylase (PgdA/CDA1 family)
MKRTILFILIIFLASFVSATQTPAWYFHRVSEDATALNTTALENTLRYLSENNYTSITYKQWYDIKNGTSLTPDKPIILTSDDGYKSTITKALPLFKKYGFIGVSAYVPVMTWGEQLTCQDLKTLQNEGWEIASHSWTHPNFITQKMTKTRMIEEMTKPIKNITDCTGVKPVTFIFPENGANSTVINLCRQYYIMCSNQVINKNINFSVNLNQGLSRIDAGGTSAGYERIGFPVFKRQITDEGYNGIQTTEITTTGIDIIQEPSIAFGTRANKGLNYISVFQNGTFKEKIWLSNMTEARIAYPYQQNQTYQFQIYDTTGELKKTQEVKT